MSLGNKINFILQLQEKSLRKNWKIEKENFKRPKLIEYNNVMSPEFTRVVATKGSGEVKNKTTIKFIT